VLLAILALFIGRQVTATTTDIWLARSAQAESLNPTFFIGGYLCCIVILCLMGYWRALCMLSSGFSAGVRCHERLLHGVLHAPMKFFESNPVGRILNRFSRDLDTVENFLPRNLFDAMHCLCDTVAVCIVIAVIAPVTMVVIVPVAILYYRLYLRYRPAARELQRLASVTLSPIFAIFSESLAGLETLRVTGLRRLFTERFSHALDTQTRIVYAQTATNRWLGVRLEMLGTVVLVTVGVVMALGLDMAVGVAFSGLALSYASAVMGSMNWAIRSLSMAENSLTSFERMERYAETEPERITGAIPQATWPTTGAVTITELSMRYRPELPLALRTISFAIPAGSRVGIVGRTGSGKSTLLLAFMRLLEPCEGRIEIDGVNLSALSLASLRQSIAVVPQEPVLFSGSLRESLDPFAQFSDVEIGAALAHVEMSQFVSSLPDGLDTRVQEGGFNFSSGQRQLICLARALLRKSKVIILDEATASIDAETDHAIQRAIREEFKGSTILVIAHRLGTVLDSDLILTLRQGELVEFGNPQELLKQPKSVLGGFLRDIQEALGTGRSVNEG
jgi:ABC-type multidrug transport system fused ATPase/permease subunit